MSEDIRPDYYKHPSGVECRQITDYLDFNLGNALKYTWRWQNKNGLDDLVKARFYLASFISLREENNMAVSHEDDLVFVTRAKVLVLLSVLFRYLMNNGGNDPLQELVEDMLSGEPVTEWRQRSLRAISDEISGIEARAGLTT